MNNTIYYEEKTQDDNNRRALLLAQTRFNAQIRAFVEGKPGRLAFVKSDIDRIVVEVTAATKADEAYVADRFLRYVAEAVAVSEPERIDLEAEGPDALPPAKFDPAKKNPAPDAETSVLDHGAVLEESIEPDAKIDLNEDTAKASCFRCDAELNPVVAKVSKVCVECSQKLGELAPLGPSPAGQPLKPAVTPVDENARVKCDYCEAKGYHFEGNSQELLDHQTQQHQTEIQQMNQGTMPTLPVTAADEEPVVVEEQTTESNPVHRFDEIVQQMADRAAAIKFSEPNDDEVNMIAEMYGVDPDELRDKLYVTATFGDFTGVNGSESEETVPDGYTEVDLEGMGGRVEAHDAEVPVNLAVQKVADDLGMKNNLVYDMLVDSYGADLSDQYHASVSGEHRYFVPSDMVSVSPESAPPQVEEELAPMASLAQLIELDRRRLESKSSRFRL